MRLSRRAGADLRPRSRPRGRGRRRRGGSPGRAAVAFSGALWAAAAAVASEAPSCKPLLLEQYKAHFPKHDKKLEIIHFNDVYNIEERDDDGPIRAGVARFVSAFDQYKAKEKLVIFSGDLFFPSNLGTLF